MILRIQIDDVEHNVDIGNLSYVNDDGDTVDFTSDERTNALHTAMTDAGLDVDAPYVILGEAV